MVVDIHESVQKKHKKKKTNSIIEEEMKGEVIDLTRYEKDSSFVFSKNEHSRKRTRKAEETEEVESSKKKQKTCFNRESSSEEIVLTSSVTEVSETKRSKKDKKSNEETEEAEYSIRKKKMNSSNRESSEEIVLASSETEVAETKRSKKDKKSKEEINLGVVDTDILQQAGINLGLPMEDTETSLPETPKVKKKKKNKEKDTSTPSDKNKNERTLDYLRSWHSNRKKWKFNKMLQVHLFHIMYEKSLLNDEDFDVMLLYLEGLNGKSREKTKEDAEKIINNDKQDTDSSDTDKEERARQIIQILS